MSTTFSGFSQFSRPEIGLLADGSQNLGEIFESDRNLALSNIFFKRENLDYVYGLSLQLSKDDLRMASGISSQLLPTLHILDQVFNKEIKTLLEESQRFSSPDLPLGSDPDNPSLSGALIQSKNVIIFNGGIQCEAAEYKTNVLGDSLFQDPQIRTTQVSTSRTSLFNSEKWPDGSPNEEYFKSAYYPGLVRVRRRSHVARVEIPESSYVIKTTGDIIENPSHTVLLNIDNGNTGTNVPLKLLATKNNPLKLLCRFATGKIIFTFEDSNAEYFYGCQVQPTTSRGTNLQDIPFLPLDSAGALTITSNTNNNTVEVLIDITSTGYQNAYDLYLYLYLNIEKVTGIDFTDINIKDFNDQKDIGLVGFNNLETLRLNGTSIKILPIWLKTLSNKLRILDLENDRDTYRSGPLRWFDLRDPSIVTPDATIPLFTGVSYLTIPVKGAIIQNNINTGDIEWADEKFEKYILNEPRVAGTDYRVFDELESLLLGDKFLGKNVRLDDVFPNLTSLSWNGKFGTTGMAGENQRLFGTPPKINKPTGKTIFRYDVSRSGCEGSIVDIGVSSNPLNSKYISKYEIEDFNISGASGTKQNISGVIGLSTEDWSAWGSVTKSINISWTAVEINLQTAFSWEKLEVLTAGASGGAIFASSLPDGTCPPLETPKLESLNFNLTTSTGCIPSLGSTDNTSRLKSILFQNCANLDPVVQDPISGGGEPYSYVLPINFAPDRGLTPSAVHKLETFDIDLNSIEGRFRNNDFLQAFKLNSFSSKSASNVTGRFFKFPSDLNNATKSISISINDSSFYDLSNLSIGPSDISFSRDVLSIVAYNQNSNGGGTKLPNFEGVSNSKVTTLRFDNCLSTQYSNNWIDSTKQGSIISPEEDEVSLVPDLQISRSIYAPANGWEESDNVFTLVGPSGENYSNKVLVNDSVRLTEFGTDQAYVLSVNNNIITIDRDILSLSSSSPENIYFKRNAVSVSNWFIRGFSQLEQFKFNNCRLTGKLNIRSNMPKLLDKDFIAFDISTNLISEYEPGSLSRIFTGTNRKITVDLSRNPFSISTIKSIINEVITLDGLNRFTNCKVSLYQCKLDSNKKYTALSQSDIFTNSLGEIVEQTINLSRFERIYETTIDNQDQEVLVQPLNELILRIPGAIATVGPSVYLGQYWKQRIDTRQRIIEDPLGVKFKALKGIKIDFDFTYSSPSSLSNIISRRYINSTTRYDSVRDVFNPKTGRNYDPRFLVNNPEIVTP